MDALLELFGVDPNATAELAVVIVVLVAAAKKYLPKTIGKAKKLKTPTCQDDSECLTSGKPQCGLALFDFVDKIDTPPTPRIATLDREVKSTGRPRRGVCKRDSGGSSVRCDKANQCAGNKACLGYAMQARQKAP